LLVDALTIGGDDGRSAHGWGFSGGSFSGGSQDVYDKIIALC
jgi:hypothetical protein